MNKSLAIVLTSVALSGLTAFAVVAATNPETPAAQQESSAPAPAVTTVNLSATDYPDFTYAAEKAVEAVVYVQVEATATAGSFDIDPFYRFFFGDEYPQSRGRVQQGSGSGVIIRSDGYIVTNNHVVANATKVEVTLNNNKTYNATVIGTDPATDVALIKIEETGLPTIEVADSDALRLGEWVLAIGSPMGRELQSTITAGIVSAKGRQMASGQRNSREVKIESFIQTDAAVNPGNSGGALVNKLGQLVGINTAIMSTTGSYTGYSFAIPSNIVSKIVDDLLQFGSVRRVMLGVTGGNLTSEMADKMKLSSPSGVYVSEVSAGGAAEKAGIRSEDVIVAVDSTPITSMSELQEKVNSFHPGDKATVTVIRDGERMKFDVEFAEFLAQGNGSVDSEGLVSFYGARLQAVEGGVKVVSAGDGKLAEAGAVDGFVIKYVNDERVRTPEQVIEIAGKSGRSIFVEGINPDGRSRLFGFSK